MCYPQSTHLNNFEICVDYSKCNKRIQRLVESINKLVWLRSLFNGAIDGFDDGNRTHITNKSYPNKSKMFSSRESCLVYTFNTHIQSH